MTIVMAPGLLGERCFCCVCVFYLAGGDGQPFIWVNRSTWAQCSWAIIKDLLSSVAALPATLVYGLWFCFPEHPYSESTMHPLTFTHLMFFVIWFCECFLFSFLYLYFWNTNSVSLPLICHGTIHTIFFNSSNGLTITHLKQAAFLKLEKNVTVPQVQAKIKSANVLFFFF